MTYPILVEYPQILLLVSRNLRVDTVRMMTPILAIQTGGGGEADEKDWQETGGSDHLDSLSLSLSVSPLSCTENTPHSQQQAENEWSGESPGGPS